MKIFCLALLLAVIPSAVLAAQGGVVDVENLPVRRGPGPKFEIIQTLKKGTPVVVSNYPTEGFYKIRTSRGEVGWVKSDSLMLYDRKVLNRIRAQKKGVPVQE